MLNLQKDIIGLTKLRNSLADVVDEIVNEHSQKVIIRKGEPVVVMVGVSEYQELQDHLEDLQDQLLALELRKDLEEMLELEAKGQLKNLEDLAAEFGFSKKDFDTRPAPDNYEDLSNSHG